MTKDCELCADPIKDLTKAWLCGPPHHWLLCTECHWAVNTGRFYPLKVSNAAGESSK